MCSYSKVIIYKLFLTSILKFNILCQMIATIINYNIIILHMYRDTDNITVQTKSTDDSNHGDEPLPRLMWCRDTFMEALNEIEDIN